jgi:NAD(P)-dependent dehydrogenase (short-subunit alcohol dehydrogenase family)
VAMVDYDGTIGDGGRSGKYGSRLKTREQPNPVIQTSRVRKFLAGVRAMRPDICLVAFKTTCNATTEDMLARGTYLLDGAKCNFVLVNDTGTRCNLIVGPSGICGEQTSDRKAAVAALVKMAIDGHFPQKPAPGAVTVKRNPLPPQLQKRKVQQTAPHSGKSGSEPNCTVITGGGRGIGRACALRMSKEGPVFLVGLTESHLQSVCAEIHKAGNQAEYLIGDVSDRSVAFAAVNKIKALGWRVRHLVCNAGIGGKGAMVEFDPEKWMRVFDVNVHGSFHFIQACLPSLIEQQGGSISLISSTLGVRGYKYDTAYSATKHAQVGIARSLGMEVAKHGVVVVPICPSFVETDMVRRMVANLMKHKNMTEAQAETYLAERNPQKRIIPADEVAEAVALVASGKLRCLNGEPLVLDGGAE